MNTQNIYEQLVQENNAEFSKLGKTVSFLINQLKTNPQLTDEQKNKINEECTLLTDMRNKLSSIKSGGIASAIKNGDPNKVAEHIAAIKECTGGMYAYTYGQHDGPINYSEYGEESKKHQTLLGEISEFVSFKDFDNYVPPSFEDTRKEVNEKVLKIVEKTPQMKAILGRAQKNSKNPVLDASIEIENMDSWKKTFSDFTYVPITFEDQSKMMSQRIAPSDILYIQLNELLEQEKKPQEINNSPKVTEENLELIYQSARKKNLLHKAFEKVKSFLARKTQNKDFQDKETDENLR